jgi:dTDP-4-amino-4,6-dideoxygalactose transaminase
LSGVAVHQVPLLDLKAQHRQIREEVLAEMIRVVDSQKFIMGEDVPQLEQEIAAYSQSNFAIGCASGSDAVFLALLALDIKAGDQVLTTPYTFFATAGAIVRAGARPVFVDIEPATFNMDMNQVASQLERNPGIRAIIPVHLFGGCADMDPLCEMAQARGIPVVEDAAQSIGSEYKQRRAGSIGQMGCFSFFPSKNLGGYGDGGILTTNDPALRERLAALRVHGTRRKYYHDWVGVNSRLDTLQAAVLRVKLRYLDSWTAGRQANAARYRAILGPLSLPITLPQEQPYQTRHIYNQFVICGPRRDELQAHLKRQGIGSEVYYPLPLHLQVCFADLNYKENDFPISERLAKESLALPVYPELTDNDIAYVCQTIQGFYA